MVSAGPQQLDLSQQAVEAKELGVADVVRQLKDPADLMHLAVLRADYEARQKANKSALSNVVISQVEAARAGMELLDKAQRHTAKLKSCFDRINQLCAESAELIDNYDKIRQLSITHGNVKKVLSELGDIVDLPHRAQLVEAMLEDDTNILPAFEALTVLEGTSVNAKAAWNRNSDMRNEHLGDLKKYLAPVAEVMARFEERLWQNVRKFQKLAEYKPTLLVDCIRIIEVQERLDKQYGTTRAEFQPKRFKSRMFREFEKLVEAKFAPLEALARTVGEPNHKMLYDQFNNMIVTHERDYLGNLTSISRVDKMGKPLPTPGEQELHSIEVIEEEVFEEGEFLDQVTDTLYEYLQELAVAYDHVAPCFPASYHIFETVFQLYHVHFGIVIDVIGQQATAFSTRGALRVMDWVAKYMETLRNLGVEEELVRLPPDPSADPERKQGVVLLMDSYIDRMETTVTTWYKNILIVDLQYEPKPAKNGTLRTPGAVDFFRILNEEVAVIEGINDRGEVVLHTAQCALRIMSGFQNAQLAVLEKPIALEMCCALLNNNIDSYDQSLEFAADVQKHLEDKYRSAIDIETACRGFLGVAKAAVSKLIELVFNDPGLINNVKDLFSTPEWLAGSTTATVVATLRDYFNDFKTFVEPGFVKRLAEMAMEELLRRSINMFSIDLPQITPAVLERMHKDERDFAAFFESFLKPERVAKALQFFDGLRTLMTGGAPAVIHAYRELVQAHARATQLTHRSAAQAAGFTPTGLTPEVLQKLCAMRSDLDKKATTDIMAQAKEAWKAQVKLLAAASAAERGEQAAVEEERPSGFFGRWGGKATKKT